jgi:choline dehydrogenase-like flavoprotein
MTMYDYIIVGGGSGGSVLAGRLSEDPAIRVALLEAGPADRSVLIHCPAGLALMAKYELNGWGYNTVPQPGLNGRRGYQPRGKVLGGSSSINAMVYARGVAWDYDQWAARGNTGWSWADVLPYFKRSEHNARGADALHGQGGPLHVMDLRSPNAFLPAYIEAGKQAGYRYNPDFNGPEQEGVGAYQVTHKNGERWSAAKGYLTPHLGRANLTVITQALTSRVLTEVVGGQPRATGIEYRGDGGRGNAQTLLLKPSGEVLLSAGSFGSPQLLMLSGIGPAEHLKQHGIAVVHELPGVGENLHDHPDVVIVVNAPKVSDLFGLSLKGMVSMLRGFFEWRRSRSGALTTNFAEGGGFIKSAPGEAIPDLQWHFVVGKLVDHGRKTVFGHGYSCHVCLLRPKSRGTLRLASADPQAAPLIDPAFLQDPDDMARMVRGFKLTRRMLQQHALTRYGGLESKTSISAQSDAQIEQFIRNHADTIYHPVGTCRMGSDAMAVVDARLRVHGVSQLRVVDASVMPQVVGGNTNAPVVMMGEKAVDMIREDRRTAVTAIPLSVSPTTLAKPLETTA